MAVEPFVLAPILGALHAAGIPGDFSVASVRQVVSSAMLAEITDFIRTFDRVSEREAWRAAALREAQPGAQIRPREVCFFSAWDFHLPPERGFKLIEFNDNGSGFLFAGIINAVCREAEPGSSGIAPPPSVAAFRRRIGDLVEREAIAFFGELPADLLLIIDDEESLQRGKFRQELRLLRDLLRERGWSAELARPGDTRWNGRRLTFQDKPVAFVVNRSTDFFWRSGDFAPLRTAHAAGRVYAAPNPFTYATRSDKRLLEWLSSPEWDGELGVEPGERRMLSAHVPKTRVLTADSVDRLVRRKLDFIFKPPHGFAGRGVLDGAAVGRARLRKLLRRGKTYLAQERVARPSLEVDGVTVWTDLRVWAYRGEILAISGRASRRTDRLTLTSPGGWIPTYVSL